MQTKKIDNDTVSTLDMDRFSFVHMQIDIDTISTISTLNTDRFSCVHLRLDIDTISLISTRKWTTLVVDKEKSIRCP